MPWTDGTVVVSDDELVGHLLKMSVVNAESRVVNENEIKTDYRIWTKLNAESQAKKDNKVGR